MSGSRAIGVGLLSILCYWVFSGPSLTEWHAVPRLNRNRVCINLIYSYYILFFSRFDTVKFPQNYDTQK